MTSVRVARQLEGSRNIHMLDSIIKKAHESQVMSFDAIPLEQLKGDIARAGHPVKQAIALDVDGSRLFFTDVDDQYLFAEFGSGSEGYAVKRIGSQSSISKEYDVIDLEPSTESGNPGETITTAHEEEDDVDTPGVYPSGTPGMKPKEDDRGYGADEIEVTRKSLIKELEGMEKEKECK